MGRSFFKPTRHLDDDQLCGLICNDLGLRERLVAQRHLADCWQCRGRHEKIQRAALLAGAMRDARLRPHLPPSEDRRQIFLKRLANAFAEQPPRPNCAFRLLKVPTFAFPSMNFNLVAGLSLAFASATFLFMWFQQRIPAITSNALLVRAEIWDPSSVAPAPGVVYQKVRITTPQQKLERAIYRDLEGRRRPKLKAIAEREENLKSELVAAGVNWDAPLSATSYQDWHDHQRVRQDRITRAGKHLLTLTTSVPTGAVASQSLTVRDTDFHPVARTVGFRDGGPVEIAELEYQVLPWTSVVASVFEPESSGNPGALATADSSRLRISLPPAPPTESQLDAADLSARLVLNHLHADTGEQIEVVRGAGSIDVKGVVETDQRKHELQAQLRQLPHVNPSIFSVEELKAEPHEGPEVTSLRTATVSTNPSPLQTYFILHGRDIGTLSDLSGRLLNSASTINLETKSLTQLLDRSSNKEEKRADLAQATLIELVFSHRQRLLAAIDEEERLLGQAKGTPDSPAPQPTPPNSADVLATLSERNLGLCKELTFGSSTEPRTADSILPDLMAALERLRSDVFAVQASSQQAALSERK